jgi:hypothetical protein
MPWLGIDGEGIGRFPHRYIMMCLSDSSGVATDWIEDVNGLSTLDCLTWLVDSVAAKERGTKTDYKLAGFYLTYDWTKVLADLPKKKLYKLLRPELRARDSDEGGGFTTVRWRGFRLHYLSGMMRIQRGDRTCVVWDVGKFFQSRFVVALENSGIAAPDLIKRMKGERGTWTEDDADRMKVYCLEECLHLARLCELLEEQHARVGLFPTSWHGPGSSAKAALKREGVVERLAKGPPEVEAAAASAYFGGRFEHRLIGRVKGVWAYDVRSAYPWAASTLPCLACAEWRQAKREPRPNELAVIRYRVTDIGARVWGPLPCRLEDDSIVWSRGGHTGWAWSVEYWAAKRGWSGVEFAGEAWVLERGCDHTPFAFVPALYQERIARPENKQVIKLILNSLYGVLAQSIGASKYASRILAGIITASCRARMLDFTAAHRDEMNLIGIATDGAFSTERHDIGSEELGGWEIQEKGAMVFLRPGIYWSERDVTAWLDEQENDALKEKAMKGVKARGVGRRHLLEQIQHALGAIDAGAERVRLGVSEQFGNARECVYRTPKGVYKRSRAYGEWVMMPCSLSLRPEPKRDRNWQPIMLPGVTSKPYSPKTPGADAQALRVIGSMLEGRL